MRVMSWVSAAVAATLFMAFAVQGSVAEPEGPVELGGVRWGNNLEGALVASRGSGRPVLVLFDEVPGCATVRGFGRTVLSHPLVVEAAETLFHPVLVYNNRRGKDAELLRFFGEPAWNNPVVRILDAERRDLAPRLDGDYTVAGLARQMSAALARSGREVPGWLTLLAEEVPKPQRAVFAVHCFWACEAELGAIGGVVATRAGFHRGREIVEVLHDPVRLDATSLASAARRAGCASAVLGDVAVRAAPGDTKYALARTPWRFVPMTEAQASRVNAAVAKGRDPRPYVSPAQARIFAVAARGPGDFPVALGVRDLRAAFARAAAKLH